MQNLFQSSLFGSSGGAASGAAWGGITGSLSSQTDLQSALDAKLNLTGGTLIGPVVLPLAANIGIANARTAGVLFGTAAATATAGITCFNNTLQFYTSSTFIAQINAVEFSLPSTTFIGFSGTVSPSSTKDLFILRGAAATLQLGQNHASVAITQVVKAHNVTSGEGAALHLKGGTGSTADGYVRVGTASGGLAFFGAGGRPIPAGDNNSNITAAGGGHGSVHADTEFDGGAGGGSYTIGGIVKMLKELGLFS